MSAQHHRPHSLEDLPKAIVERNWKTRLIWLVPLGAAALAAYFIYIELLTGGPTLHIYFTNAQDLDPGKSEVKYRGVQIGTVQEVKLTKDHRGVVVTLSLTGSGREVAREGSRFWIVRPHTGVKEIQAPATIISGDYITVEPGEGNPQTRFVGLPQAPILEPEGAVRIVLFSERLGSVKRQSPIFYRGIQVGEVFDCQLGPESQTIRIMADINKHYAPLLRMNSRFWNAGGIHVNLGLTGADISAQSAETLVGGGIDFATPDTSREPAPAGTAFRLYDKAEDVWLSWAPRIALDPQTAPKGPEVSQLSKWDSRLLLWAFFAWSWPSPSAPAARILAIPTTPHCWTIRSPLSGSQRPSSAPGRISNPSTSKPNTARSCSAAPSLQASSASVPRPSPGACLGLPGWKTKSRSRSEKLWLQRQGSNPEARERGHGGSGACERQGVRLPGICSHCGSSEEQELSRAPHSWTCSSPAIDPEAAGPAPTRDAEAEAPNNSTRDPPRFLAGSPMTACTT